MTSAKPLFLECYCAELGCRPDWVEELPEYLLSNLYHARAVLDYCKKMDISPQEIPLRIRNLSLPCLRAEIQFVTQETCPLSVQTA